MKQVRLSHSFCIGLPSRMDISHSIGTGLDSSWASSSPLSTSIQIYYWKPLQWSSHTNTHSWTTTLSCVNCVLTCRHSFIIFQLHFYKTAFLKNQTSCFWGTNQYTDTNVEVSTKFHSHLQKLFEYNCYFLYYGGMQGNVLGINSNSDCKCNSGL